MTVDEQLRNNPVIQNKILGVLAAFCIESPVRICFDKLSKSKHQYLSLNEIAWLEAISEMKFDSFCVIRWEGVKRQLSFPVRDNYDCRFPNIKL